MGCGGCNGKTVVTTAALKNIPEHEIDHSSILGPSKFIFIDRLDYIGRGGGLSGIGMDRTSKCLAHKSFKFKTRRCCQKFGHGLKTYNSTCWICNFKFIVVECSIVVKHI